MSASLLAIALVAGISGCGEDPVLEAARQNTGASAEAAPAEPAPSQNRRRSILDDDAHVGNPDAPEHKAGVPGEPSPGEPGKPTPGEAGEPGEGIPDDPEPGIPDEPPPEGGDYRKPPPIEGPSVMVRGTIELADWKQGRIRIDVFDGDQLQFGGKRPGVVTMLMLEEPGAFELEVPESVGRVWISAFNDEDVDNRPGPVDPTGYYPENPVLVTDGDVAGVTITLERRDPPGGKVDEGL